jgi:hypothetical protein
MPDFQEEPLRLIHTEIVLDFVEEFRSYSISQQLYKALTGKTSAAEELVEPGVEFRSPKKKQLVNWDTGSCRVVTESVTNSDECVRQMVALLQTINKVAPIGKLSRRELITHWILPAEGYRFKSLEQKYREIFITHQPPWKNVFDSSVIIDMRINDLILHHQSGAMKTKQLRQEFVEFKLGNVPRVFLFLWATIESDRLVEYSAEDINHFLTTSLQHCKHHSELLEETWRKIL